MKKLSNWASHHKWTARIIITVLNFVIIFLGWVIGSLLPEASAGLATGIFFSLCVLTFYIWFIYPSVKKNYLKRKLCEFAVGFFTLAFSVLITNYGFPVTTSQALGSTTAHVDTTLKNHSRLAMFKAKLEKAKEAKLTRKEKRQIVKAEIRSIKRDQELTDAEKAGIIILTILLAAAVLLGTAALGCQLSCSGSGAGAVLVVAAGLFLTVFVIMTGIRYANGDLPKKKKKQN